MMDYTDRHCRYLLRLLAPHARLYTEMVTTGAILRGDRDHLLAFNAEEHPVALQLGGSDPHDLARAARIGAEFGYDEINLNVGCPSNRVRTGRFGACLMAEPRLVADCVAAMRAAVNIPVTVKSRIGIDERDSYEEFTGFITQAAQAGCDTFIVHARKAWLQGLSPKQNREIPPLRYDFVYRLKREFPHLTIVINGGITTVAAVREHLAHVDGVMIGRAAIDDSWLLATLEQMLFGTPAPQRADVARRYAAYIEAQLARDVPLNLLARPLLGLYHGVPGARAWRRTLSTAAPRPGMDARIVDMALANVSGA